MVEQRRIVRHGSLARRGAAWLSLVLAGMFAAPVTRAEDPSPGPNEALALKQEMIRDRFKRFEDRVFRLREQLESDEPGNADRLARVLERAGEAGLSDRLEELIRLLRDPSTLTEAVDQQAKWVEDADRILAILLEQDSLNEERKNEMERLREYREQLDKLLEEQRSLRGDAGDASQAKRLGQQLDQALRRLDALQKQQEAIRQATAKAATGKDADPRDIGEAQQEIQRATKELSDDVRSLSEPGEGESAEEIDRAKAEAKQAAESLQGGAEQMQKAGDSLQQGDASGAKSPQQSASEALEKAKEQLEKAKDALEKKQQTAEQAKEQRDTAQRTKDLADRMQQEGGGSSGSKGGQKKGQSSPGEQSLDNAQKEMDDAAESLEQEKPSEAAPMQDNAIRELEQARRELDEALQQLREEERAETLRDLEARFREMLTQQRAINEQTVTLDGTGKANFGRAERLQLADLAVKQRGLSDDAATAGHILEEEGTTVVFPRVVEQIAGDMVAVAERLAASETGMVTQTIENEIVDALEQLLEAVQKMQQENASRGGQGGGGGGNQDNQSLLPDSAELKLLKSAQVRVNTRTAALDAARAEGAESAESLAQALQKVAERQKDCRSVAEEMRDRQKRR